MSEEGDNPRRCDLKETLQNRHLDENEVVFVDFDHTIFSCNSTELFIASCRPSLLVALIDLIVRRCIPWQLTRLPRWFRLRDYVCCLVILLLTPWNYPLWKRKAPSLFRLHESQNVRAGLEHIDLSRVVIVTFGMDFIVRSLLRGSRWQDVELVATPLSPHLTRFGQGKLALLTGLFGPAAVANSTAVSDSLDDRDLLLGARHGILIDPQGAEFRAAEHLYLPLRYTLRAKYPASYVFDQVLLVDLLLLILATAHHGRETLEAVLYMPLLLISMMCVYEIGYYENDTVAARREVKPTLTKEAKRFADYPIYPGAWVWAVITGAAGCAIGFWLGEVEIKSLAAAMGLWILGLLVLRGVFYAYNRLRTQARVAIYPVLHFMKYFPIFVLVHPTAVGALLALSQIATMWVVYMTYRLGGNQKGVPKEMFRTGLWLIGTGFLAAGGFLHTREILVVLGLMAIWSVVRISKPFVMQYVRRSDLRSAVRSALSF